MAEAKHKPLSFSTTMRNPVRIAWFLKCVQPYEGEILTNDIIYKIISNVIRNKLYFTVYEKKVYRLKNIFKSIDENFTDADIQEIISNSPQKHKEAGFDYWRPSRFDTWYKIQKEFWFIWYSMWEKIEISPLGYELISAIEQEQIDSEKIQNIFLNSLVKYQTSNPFRKTLNDNVPLMLLLNVINKLKVIDPNSCWIYRREIPFFICRKNNDAQSLCDFLISFRNWKLWGYSDEIVYNECLNILWYWEKDKDYIKISQVEWEAVDEYIRKMRITWVISLRWNWRALDFNTLEQEKINYILWNYQNYQTYDDWKEYYEYMWLKDDSLFSEVAIQENKLEDLRKRKLKELAWAYNTEEIFSELTILSKNQESKHDLLKFIDKPVRLEFLTALSLVQNFPTLEVSPNYTVDDEWLPKYTAGWWIADIVCEDWNNRELVEVTMMSWRNQVHNEIIPIARHLKESKQENENSYSLFIAPVIHPDASEMVIWYKHKDDIDIKALKIEDYIEKVKLWWNLIDIIIN